MGWAGLCTGRNTLNHMVKIMYRQEHLKPHG